MTSFFAGYGVTQSFGGRVAEHFGGKHVVGYGVMIAALVHLLVPIAASVNFYVLVAQRVVTGLALVRKSRKVPINSQSQNKK
jgi:MFS family permease